MKPLSNYQQCVEWLFDRFAAYQNIGANAYKPGLERVYALLDLLQIDPNHIPSIHIAGTNGKGSTAAYCASMLQQKGLKVGLFTSPHIFDFSERIRVNGKPISQEAVMEFCHMIQHKDAGSPSFFELTFAMALSYYQSEACDYMVIETGMGGRLDATNVLLPKVSIITNIDLDHQEFLGNTVQQIAFEKAGIIKSKTPVVIGDLDQHTQAIFKNKAQELEAPILFVDEFMIALENFALEGYQLKNFKTALVAMNQLGFKITSLEQKASLTKLAERTGFFGRIQIWQEKPLIIMDVSHNVAGIKATLPIVISKCQGKLFILYGAAQDKDVAQIMALFPAEAHLAACVFSNPRSKTFEDWKKLGIHTIYEHLDMALEQIKEQMSDDDLLWITGSFFLISDLPTKKRNFL